ncbi:MAG: 50S ribosomal protein L25 [Victivallaceae bacterium]|nr:50S ribosomal protein L25 [Victivallaceae bacterium]
MSKVSNVINVTPRTEFGNGASRRARRNGQIPAVVYSKGVETRRCLVDTKEWEAVNRHEVGLLTLKEGRKECAVLAKDVQFNTLKGMFVHIDFIEVKMDVEITTMVQIHHGGEDAIGLSQGGVLEQPAHEIEVRCLPADLPEGIEVNISGIEIDASLLAEDIILPTGVTLESDPEMIVFRVNKPTAEVAVEATEDEGEGEGEGEGETKDAAEDSGE